MTAVAFDELRPPTDREFRLFQQLVYETAGIHLGPAKRALLSGRLSRRVRELGFRTFGAYYDFLKSNRDSEECELLDRITTNETSFFREPRHFEFLRNRVVPERGRSSIRIWSAGCSTGEEPYSIAMTLREALVPEGQIEIVATDLSRRVLDRASSAEWPSSESRAIPQDLLRKYMLKGIGPNAGKFKAQPELRQLVRFLRLNLNQPVYAGVPSDLDAIFCRNVLIYFDARSKRAVIERLVSRLRRGGHLFIGHAESLVGVDAAMRCVEPTVYVRE